jgi:hypothetical protein
VSRKVHTDAEKKPPSETLRALQEWLDANGMRRSALVEPLGVRQAQILRLFAGEAYLSATQRRALEEFTGRVITAAMLEGKAKPPAKIAPKPLPSSPIPGIPGSPHAAPMDDSAAPVGSMTGAPGSPRPQSPEEAERAVDELATRAMPAAFKLIVQQMIQGKSESERRRCAEVLIEHLRGKAKQYEKREQMEPPATDEELLAALKRIEKNLGGRRGGGSNGTESGPDVDGREAGHGNRAADTP